MEGIETVELVTADRTLIATDGTLVAPDGILDTAENCTLVATDGTLPLGDTNCGVADDFLPTEGKLNVAVIILHKL